MRNWCKIQKCSTFAAIALVGAFFTTSAHAQIGSNWQSYSPSSNLQLRGTGTHSNGTFTISAASGEQRAERRVLNEYTSGSRQFEGYLIPYSGNGTCMKQTFKSYMLVAWPDNGGTLRYYTSGPIAATGVWGRSFRYNTLHYTSTQKIETWINGSKKYTSDITTYTGTGWYDKYGVYNVQSGIGKCNWSSVRFWRK